ncbi:copper-binding protein [Ramlibacter sp. AN1015]|uniref:copper-binding protein n=1 Tax=Ramlibacter sp. AN1015 TaxID=3133428 RepID=UPI0030BBE9B8
MQAKHMLAFAASLMALAAGAQQVPASGDHASHHPAAAGTAAASGEPRSEGEVRKVDLEQGKVTLRHGPLANLDMPAMTMVFTAADPGLLEGLKQGDKVRFVANKKDGTYFVTTIESIR